VNPRDRLTSLSLFAAAAGCWIALGFVFVSFDPQGDAVALLGGAILLGIASALTLVPLLWLAGFARGRRIAYRGDWLRAGRRGALVGLIVALFVVLRGQDALSPPLAIFIVAMAILVEITLSLRR
jgi:hypothetical protein